MNNPLSNPDLMGQTDWIEDLTDTDDLRLDDIVAVAPLDQLIGTETCSYCHTLTECLSLPDDGDTERHACRYCIARAFDDVFGGPIRADEDPELEGYPPYWKG